MSDLRELYQEVILDHNKRPRNFRAITPPSQKAEGFNPLCGDRITVYVRMNGDVIEDVSFEGSGCAISKASGSLMTSALKGRTISEADSLFKEFHKMVTAPADVPVETGRLDKLIVFSGVREYPVRVKCASLAWHTLRAALEARQDVVSTE
jgi:nitrogen fixation protein NifU and related proteins